MKTTEKHWSFREYDASDRQLALEKAPFEMAFADLYDEVDFALKGPEG